MNDSTNAFNAAISAAGAGGTVWIPPGTYNIPGHISVNNVTIAGAGMWYSTVTGTAPGFYGNSAPSPSTNVHLQNFAIFGNVQDRCDSCQVNGIGGAMSNSTVSNIWIEHMKVGAWMDGPMNGLTFSGMRIRDTTADGINFHGGVTNSTVTNSDIRNTGDDGIATWADSSIGADANDTISNNTVQLQQLANGIAIYGGHDNTVSGNLVVDTGITQGGGIQVGQRFNSTPVGTTTISNNTLIRDGDLDPNWQFGVGALWFDGSQGAITGPINVTNTLIEQSPYEAVQWVEGTISGVSLNNVTIAGTGTFALQEQTGGAATFTNVTATGVNGPAPVYNCEGGGFTVTDGGGNSGISGTPYCGNWPAPVYPPYPSTGVTVAPSALSFGSVATGTTSAPQTVTVSNPTNSAAPVSSISVSGDYAQSNNCGSSIAANGSCTVSVTFTPTAAGTRTGTLTVNAGGVTNTVSLTGTGTAPGPVLTASPASLSFAGTVVGSTAAAQTVTVTNSGTTSATVSSVAVTGDFNQTNNCTSIAVGGSCAVTVTFKPTAGGTRTGTLTVTSNANNSPTTVALSGVGIDSSTNIAAGQPASASSVNGPYVAANLTDSDPSSYWESANGSFPQWAQVDLGQSYSINKVVLRLPPLSSWGPRTETLSLLGSTDGTNFSTIVGSAGYNFDPNTNNNTVARAAAARETAMGLSSFASKPLDEVIAANPKTFFQTYWIGTRDEMLRWLEWARSSGAVGIIVTLDWSFSNGRDWGSPVIPETMDLKAMLRYAPQAITRPRWLWNYAKTGSIPDLTVPNLRGPEGKPAPTFFGAYRQWMQSPLPTWEDVAWLRQQWGDGPFMLKGITRVDDAKRAVDAGVSAISVSNHGGNNLDGTPATIRALPAVADAVGQQVEVVLDGGVRRGGDVVKALALGARAVMIGRAYLWGLAANGQAGVENVLDILRGGIDSALLGLGHSSIRDLTPGDVIIPPGFTRRLGTADDTAGQ